MKNRSKLSSFLDKRKRIIPILFGLMCFFVASSIVGLELKISIGQTPLDTNFGFSIGGEIGLMVVAVMMAISILPTYKRQSPYIRVFFTLLAAGTFVLFLDAAQMMVDGEPALAVFNKILSVLVFSFETIFMYFFWLYASYMLKCNSKATDFISYLLSGLCLLFVLLPFVNFFYPIYFYIDDVGVYHRNIDTWWICRIFMVTVVIGVVISIIVSKEKGKTKAIISVFMGLPILAILAGGFRYGVSITYTAMMASLVLIYVVLFSETENYLYSTSKELSLATDIQKNVLPSIFPAFPDRKEFDIYAAMSPAKEVGGDFYDFFLIDDTHLGLVIADVSDKGVPAALFMMATKIMIQNFALLGLNPAKVLESANQEICENNQTEMFVTVWLGVLDLETGILTAANAGHEKPVLKKADGAFEILDDKRSFVVGGYRSTKFIEYQIKMEKGEKLFLYTDGVPEASTFGGKQFGLINMLKTLNQHKDEDPSMIIHHVKEEIDKFVGSDEQFDDITMVCVQYNGSEMKNIVSYECEADIANLEAMLNPIMDKLRLIGVNQKLMYQINLALEELFVNVAHYAYYPNKGIIHIQYQIKDAPKRLIVTIKDEGTPFNPLESEEPDLNAPIQERKIGGLGLFIVKRTMDDIKYTRENGSNILEITKQL